MVPSVIKGHVLHLFLLQRKAPGVLGGRSAVFGPASMPRRLLHRRNDMRGGEGNAALHRCEERRMFKLLKLIRRMLGRAGLNVTTNEILLDSFFEGFAHAAGNLTNFLYFFFNKTVCISSLV